MKTFTDFVEAYHWLDEHPIFKDPKWRVSHFQQGLYMMVVRVNPESESIDEDDTKNTAPRVWLEHGHYGVDEKEGWEGCYHDIDLDCGAPTFEKAILELAQLVYGKHGDYDEEEESQKDDEVSKHTKDFFEAFRSPNQE